MSEAVAVGRGGAGQGSARPGRAWFGSLGKLSQGWLCDGGVWFGLTWQPRYGVARSGRLGLGRSGRVSVWQSRPGTARSGSARHRVARWGMAGGGPR